MIPTPWLDEQDLIHLLEREGLLDSTTDEILRYVREQHGSQQRLGGSPVLEEHIFPVTADVVTGTVGEEKTLRQIFTGATLLHDVVEDCGISQNVLAVRFGFDIAELVNLLSDCWQPGSRKKPVEDYWRGITDRAGASVIRIYDRRNNLRCAHKLGDPAMLREFLTETSSRVIPLVRCHRPLLLDEFDAAVERLWRMVR